MAGVSGRFVMVRKAARVLAIVVVVASAIVTIAPTGAGAQGDPLPTDLPIVFVHGGAGSAAQYRTQQMRFASNGYPNVVTAIDRAAGVTFNTEFDAFIDDLLAETGDDQVFVLGHSLGTGIMNGYLNSDPARADRVAKYISLDGAPANCGAIPTVCMNITGVGLGGQGHTQTVTSPESFALQHQFLTGTPPTTTAVVPEASPEISGRVINFPANDGPGEGTLDVYEIDSLTGHRTGDDPIASFQFTDADDGGTEQTAGAWGPITVDPSKHYEFAVTRAVSDATAHYYMQNFTRSSDLIRLLSAPPDAPTVVNTEVGDDHAAAVVIRYKEWWGGRPDGTNDSLKVSTTSTLGPFYDSGSPDFPAFGDPTFPEQLPTEVINGATSPASSFGKSIGIHLHDTGSDGITNAATPIPFFFSQPFQTGVDLYMPADDPVDGTIHMVSSHRGDVDRPQVINTPNWPSADHRIVVEFNDYIEEEPEQPVVFVHGGSGSAAQYQSQSMRFSSNGYGGHIAAIDRNGPTAGQLDQLDDFIDDVLADTGADQVNLIGHSFGVFITNNYLSSDPSRAAKVARSIGVDSGSGSIPDVCPGNVPCKGIWGQETSGRLGQHGPYNNVRFADQGHVQAITSAESFAAQYRFFTGHDPATTDVLPEANPTIAGRVVQFPANLGPGDVTLNIWEIDGATGHRTSATPYATFEFDASENGGDQSHGAWGPVAVDPTQHYELETIRAGSAITGHYYKEPFTHSNHFIRFLLLPEIALGPPLTEIGPDHSAIVALRYKEWWTGHSLTPNDSLQVGTSLPGGAEQPPVEVITDTITPVTKGAIGIHMFDVGSDATTDLGAPIPFWFSQGFQTGADVFLPASDPPTGTITLRSVPHDAPDQVQMLNVPNWPSDRHRSGIEFNDFPSPSEPGVIEGRVVDGDGLPLDGATVRAYLIGDTWVGPGFATTGPDGSYAMPVPAGQYRVLFQGPSGAGYSQEWWDDSPGRDGGAHVLVTPSGTAPDVDAELHLGAAVTGTVTGPGGPIDGARVWVYRDTDTWVGTAMTTTGADGTYNLRGIPTGSYRVLFQPPPASGLVDEWWDDAPNRLAGTVVSLVAGTTTPDIDAQLAGP
jgi:pimeloyl-ACP methyl ester carboxylesterase